MNDDDNDGDDGCFAVMCFFAIGGDG